jgi:hypothetical protein
VNPAARLLCCATVAALLLLPATGFAHDETDAPAAEAVSVTAHGVDSARVSGVVQLGKGSALYWFEYGPTPALELRSTAGTATHEDDDKDHRVAVARALTGLAPATTYYVRLVAESDSGRSNGPSTTFTTDAAPATAPAPPSSEPPVTGPPAAESDGAVIGERFVAAAASGSVRVRLPGADGFVDLGQATAVPVGTVVDARHGALALTTALPGGGVQQASFGGGRFEVRQRPASDGRTDLYLRGGRFARCGRAARPERTLAAVAAKRPKPVRRLWGRDKGGRFRTHGRDSVATVRGTKWTMVDRCDGTLTRVSEGAVDVRDRHTGRTVRVEAGERHFARHRG